jgi:hypothetical protein
MVKRIMCLALFAALAFAGAVSAQHCGNCPMGKANASTLDSAQVKPPVFVTLAGYDKKCWIGQDYYFTYKFDKKPKMGMLVLKVKLFDKNGKKEKSLVITGRSGMPSMSGAHDFEQPFKQNKLGEYLLPVNIVMPGEWEIKMTFSKDKKPFYFGMFRFNV